jgi:hypothetical protein
MRIVAFAHKVETNLRRISYVQGEKLCLAVNPLEAPRMDGHSKC